MGMRRRLPRQATANPYTDTLIPNGETYQDPYSIGVVRDQLALFAHMGKPAPGVFSSQNLSPKPEPLNLVSPKPYNKLARNPNPYTQTLNPTP